MNTPVKRPLSLTARTAGTTTVKDAIGQLMAYYKLQTRYDETYLVAFWANMVGPQIASRTKKVFVKDGKLFVEITSAPMRNELVSAKGKLISLLNRDMGNTVIEDVVFI
jgi:predicted nucleic acid-binding Zn ribbon protein